MALRVNILYQLLYLFGYLVTGWSNKLIGDMSHMTLLFGSSVAF